MLAAMSPHQFLVGFVQDWTGPFWHFRLTRVVQRVEQGYETDLRSRCRQTSGVDWGVLNRKWTQINANTNSSFQFASIGVYSWIVYLAPDLWRACRFVQITNNVIRFGKSSYV